MSKFLISFVAIYFISLNVYAQDSGQKQYGFFKDQKTFIKNPFELRDPFRRAVDQQKMQKKKGFNSFGEGNVFTNVPQIEELDINKIKIVGVLLGKERRAMAHVEGNTKDTIVLKEGMKIGSDNAEIKAILPGGIVLVEKIVNVYDQEEYLETIIPITEDGSK